MPLQAIGIEFLETSYLTNFLPKTNCSFPLDKSGDSWAVVGALVVVIEGGRVDSAAAFWYHSVIGRI